MRGLRFGLVGCGAMGNVIVGHVIKRWGRKARWTGLCDTSAEAARALCTRWSVRIPIQKLDRLVAGADWVVEAASSSVVPGVLRHCLAKKKNLVVHRRFESSENLVISKEMKMCR